MLNMDWPQLTYLALNLIGLGIITAKHGEQKEDKYNIFVSGGVFGFVVFLLYSGGFFTKG